MLYIDEDVWGFELEPALAELPRWRREYALSYRFERDRRLCVAAWRLLEKALKAEFGLETVPEIAKGEFGKPYFPGRPDIHFNLSHCAQAAVCIVGNTPVGVDVEGIAPVEPEVMEKALSPAEIAAVKASANPEVEFARFWTRREAALKCRGKGLGELAGDLDFTGLKLTTETRNNYILSTAIAAEI